MDAATSELFSSLASEADLKAAFITAKQPETNHIEFKQKVDARVPDLAEADKRYHAKALSAFSNADGGLLVWGIKTRQNAERDYASNLKPVKQAGIMAERLRSFLIDGLMPQNPGIRIEAIVNRVGNGYVKCLIPASLSVPHRSMVDREYWVRLDGRSVKLEHYLIRDMMLRHANPDLDLRVTADKVIPPNADVRLLFVCRNRGRAIAKHAGWFAEIQNARIVDPHHCQDLTLANDNKPHVAWDSADLVIHPVPIDYRTGEVDLMSDNRALPILVSAWCYCEDMAGRRRSFSIVLEPYPPRVELIEL